jgi:hypothetical protein
MPIFLKHLEAAHRMWHSDWPLSPERAENDWILFTRVSVRVVPVDLPTLLALLAQLRCNRSIDELSVSGSFDRYPRLTDFDPAQSAGNRLIRIVVDKIKNGKSQKKSLSAD